MVYLRIIRIFIKPWTYLRVGVLMKQQQRHSQNPTQLQIWRWCWTWAYWSGNAHTASSCSSRSCTSTWLRRARLGAAWVPNPSRETASPRPPPRNGCSRSAPGTTASETAAWCGSAPGGWSLSPNPLKQKRENKKQKLQITHDGHYKKKTNDTKREKPSVKMFFLWFRKWF